jgi:hypothetical protein
MSLLSSCVLVAVVRYVYTGDLFVDLQPHHHNNNNNMCTVAGDLLEAESLLGLEDTGLRIQLEDLLLRELARVEAGGGHLEDVLVFWNLGMLHELPRLLEAVFSLLDLRLESFVLEAAGGRSHVARLGFEVRCVPQRTTVFFYLITYFGFGFLGPHRTVQLLINLFYLASLIRVLFEQIRI